MPIVRRLCLRSQQRVDGIELKKKMFCSSLSVCNSPACLSSAIHMDNDRHGVFNSAASEPQMIIVKLVFCRVKKDEIGQKIGYSTSSR
jgi:hypothetical protein